MTVGLALCPPKRLKSLKNIKLAKLLQKIFINKQRLRKTVKKKLNLQDLTYRCSQISNKQRVLHRNCKAAHPACRKRQLVSTHKW